MSKQLSLSGKLFNKPKDAFGGSLLKGNNPKTKRPLDSRMPILLTLRAERSGMRKLGVLHKLNAQVYAIAKKHRVRVYNYSNVGNHLHLLIKIPRIHRWAAFIRELTGQIAQLMLKTIDLPEGLRFWRYRPHTRIVRGWKRAYKIAKEYVELNGLEATGSIDRRQVPNLKALRELLQV
jgi:REP element-mobilizing transposase RayT